MKSFSQLTEEKLSEILSFIYYKGHESGIKLTEIIQEIEQLVLEDKK